MSELDPELYTVAWFAPLEIEAQAALHMLDNKHRGRFPMGRGDDYVFQAGDMCGHNVIIATLPAGQEYGTGSAAALASQVKRFFPNLWFGLLVGVAAGLPNFSQCPPLDIRLGDVLVGLPTSESAGLIAYDLGKETGQNGFQLLRFGHVLATTETVVRSAIGSIKLLAPNDAEAISPYYESIKHKRHPNGTFVDPGQKQDILYQIDDDGNERLVERERRLDDERTRVWYGTIGSGDKLMKNARKRNELRDKYNVIGLEMEAAGTMNRIPVGVIRGVCDYGDEHKNKEWQPYAAAMAAAYAKAVLSEIPARTIPNKPVAPQNVAPRMIATDDRVKKRRLDEEYPASITDNRCKKHCGYEEVAEASGNSNGRAAQSISRGQGIQQTGGNFSVGGNLSFVNTCARPHNNSVFPDDHIWCLQDLRITDPRDDKDRIQQTKGGLLADSYRWILDNADYRQWHDDRESRLLWIKGDPGKGKTMLICGIIDELKKSAADGGLLSFFFCQGTDSRINNATAVLRGLIYLLVNEQPSLILHVRKKYDHAGKALFEDANAWVALSEIFANILQDQALKSTYLIVDGLDECQKDLLQLLDLIVQMSSISPRVKWIVSSRNWPEIQKRLETAGEKVKLCLELNAESVSAAVGKYIRYKVDRLARLQKYDKKTRDAVRDHLSSNANGTFLWVALVCQHLEKVSRWNTLAKLDMNMFPPGLDALYKRMMEQICNSHDVDICKRILACVTTVYRPITLKELTSFDDELEATSDDLESLGEIIGLCGSFLTTREGIIYFVHQSAKDFLLGKASDGIFPSGMQEVHYTIFSRSLQTMSRTLRRDIYGLHAPGFPVDQINEPEPDPLAAVRYSCIYWVDHLCDFDSSRNAKDELRDGGAVDKFLRQKYIYWLEALSLLRSMSEGVLLIAKLEGLLQGKAEVSRLIDLVRDARRFIRYHKWIIENTPLQVYTSALVFSPARSLIRELFKQEEPEWITTKPAMQDDWSSCLQTLEGHSGPVSLVAFSHDDKHLASASHDVTVKIWDTASGKCLQTLEGHSGLVSSVAFSHEDKHLASASNDTTVRIWDTASGKCLQTLEGHSRPVSSVAFSHDDKHLASASEDTTVKIWDTVSGKCLQTLEGHSEWVSSVAFSHDDKHLPSASSDSTVKVWDTASGKCLQTLEGHSGWVSSVAFSHDDKHLASASKDITVKIWDTVLGKCLQTLEGHSEWVSSVAFSHDDKHLASASEDTTVKIWDTVSGKCLQTLEGHSGWVSSVAFSHDDKHLASASGDTTVKIWHTVSGKCLQTLEGHSGPVNSVAFSHDDKHLASASSDSTVRIWDKASGKCLQTFEGHSGWVSSVAFSHDDKHLASASSDSTVKIWDTTSGKCLQTLEGHSEWVSSVAFSHDDKHLASASGDTTVKIWDTVSGKCLQTLEGHSEPVSSVAFSHDDKHLTSASEDTTVKIWDTVSGKCLQTLEGQSEPVRSVAFSHDDKHHLASALSDSTVMIWDMASGKCLQTLEGYRGWMNLVAFSHDDKHLALASGDSTIKIWDTAWGKCLQTLEGHIGPVSSVAFSHDDKHLASASDDTTVKIWDTASGKCLQTLDVSTTLYNISFDAASQYLRTEIGAITLDVLSASGTAPSRTVHQKPQYQGLGISSDRTWIMCNSENLLWLPQEYRPERSAVRASTVAIGCASGPVLIFNFYDPQLLS